MEWPRRGMSPWLAVTIVAGCFVFFLLIVWENHAPGGTVRDALWSWQRREYEFGPSTIELATAVGFQVALIWFTFFSGNRRVTEDDKKLVTLMLFGAAIAWVRVITLYFTKS
jgi:hypothetical protein